MTIDEYKKECQRIRDKFPSAFPKEYLNKTWSIWKDLPHSELKKVTDRMISRNAAECLAITGMHAKNCINMQQVHNHERANVTISGDGLNKLLESNEALSAWDLVQKLNQNSKL